jgi:hypothetical protein
MAEQATVAAFMQHEGGPTGYLEWLDGVGVSPDMPDYVLNNVAARVRLVRLGLDMDELSAAVGQLRDELP